MHYSCVDATIVLTAAMLVLFIKVLVLPVNLRQKKEDMMVVKTISYAQHSLIDPQKHKHI